MGPRSEIHNNNFVFTAEQEEELTGIILDLTLKHREQMDNEKFQCIAIHYALSHGISRPFNCSTKFITSFRERNDISIRRAHLKRRPAATEEKIAEFLRTVRNLWETVDHNYLINADECPWHTNEIRITTWADKGRDNIIIEGEDKECFTFIGGINANGEHLPPVLLAAGKTDRVDRNWFGEAHPIGNWNQTSNRTYITDHTKHGWTNRKSWARYLDFLRKYISGDKDPLQEPKIYLICDSYSAHFQTDNPEELENDPVYLAIC